MTQKKKKLLAGTIIPEFLGNPRDFIATSNAAVPLQMAARYLFPTNFGFSNSFPYTPLV